MTWDTLHTSIRDALEQTAQSDANVLERARRGRARLQRARREQSQRTRVLALAAAGVLLLATPWLAAQLWPVVPAVRIAKEMPRPAGTTTAENNIPRKNIAENNRADEVRADQSAPPRADAPASAAAAPHLPQQPTIPTSTPKQSAAPDGPADADTPSWEAVAQAMRRGDDAQARAMIQRLQQSPDVETREHARLTALQLRASHTQGPPTYSESERQELQELSLHGASSSVRLAARQLLERSTAAQAKEGQKSE